MGEIFFYILVIIFLFFLFVAIRSLVKRILLMTKLGGLKKAANAKIKYNTLPFFSLLKFSKKPEITVEIGRKIYLIRLIGARSNNHRVHFANSEYTVTIKGRLSGGNVKRYVRGGMRGMRFLPVSQEGYKKKIGKVRILPRLEVPENPDFRAKTVIPVLIFNPAPHEVTYVTKEKNRVVAAFTGDDVYGQMIFTASSFAAYAERAAREEKEQVGSSSYWDEYYS